MGLSQIKVCLSELSHESRWQRGGHPVALYYIHCAGKMVDHVTCIQMEGGKVTMSTLHHAKERHNRFAARKFKVLETKYDGGNSENRSWYLLTAPKSISVEQSMVVSRNKNKK